MLVTFVFALVCVCVYLYLLIFGLAHSIFKGEEVGRPLLLDEDVQAGVQLCLHQQEGLPDG